MFSNYMQLILDGVYKNQLLYKALFESEKNVFLLVSFAGGDERFLSTTLVQNE